MTDNAKEPHPHPSAGSVDDLVPRSEMVDALASQRRRMGAEYDALDAELKRVRQVAKDEINRLSAQPRTLPTRRQLAEAIAAGWTDGNETYDAQNDIIRMRIDHAAGAVLDLLGSSQLSRPQRGGD